MKIAVILFPGTNCENETKLVCEKAGMEADIVRWNDHKNLSDYDGYILPGGWSYEDRIRAGAIASKDSVMDIIKAEAKKGKPVLGICNGCQVLIETGMVPGLDVEKVEMALAHNINPKISGFYCTWINLVDCSKRENAFNLKIQTGDVIPMPIAHGEGRFATNDKELLQKLIDNDQIMFKYCDSEGTADKEFPINPNGSLYNIAGITNKEGNVLAMMPHPERAAWQKQLPGFEAESYGEMEKPALALKIFESMKEYIEK